MEEAAMNAPAMMWLGAFRLMHGAARDGLGLLLIALVAMRVAIPNGAQGAGKALGCSLFAAGAPEGTDAEVEKDQRQAGENEESPMVRTVEVTGAGRPRTSPYKNRDKDKIEGAGDFEPEDAADAAEGANESAYATVDRRSGLARRLPGLKRSTGRRLAGDAVAVHETLDQRPCNTRSLKHLGGGRGPRADREVVPCGTSDHTHSNAQDAANDARSHTVYDGSSGLAGLARWQRFPSCSKAGLAVR